MHAPEVEVVVELVAADVAGLAEVHVQEGLAERPPLDFDLLDQHAFEVALQESPCGCLPVLVLPIEDLLLLILLEGGVHARVVAEEEALWHVNRVAHPPGKVLVVEPAFVFRILVLHELLQLAVVHVRVRAEEPEQVLRRDVAIKVGVKRQEGLPQSLEPVLEPLLHLLLQLQDARLKDDRLAAGGYPLAQLPSLLVTCVVRQLRHVIVLREEVLLEDIERHAAALAAAEQVVVREE